MTNKTTTPEPITPEALVADGWKEIHKDYFENDEDWCIQIYPSGNKRVNVVNHIITATVFVTTMPQLRMLEKFVNELKKET